MRAGAYTSKQVGNQEVWTKDPKPKKLQYVRSKDPDENRRRTKSNWSFIQQNERRVRGWLLAQG